jgi:O-antigen ligase
MNNFYWKNLVVVFVELVVVFLMAIGWLPREMSLFLTALLLIYILLATVEEALWVFVVSIPLFVALPIVPGFDTMANWRLLLSLLFLVWFFKKARQIGWVPLLAWLKKIIYQRLVAYFIIFLGVGLVSLLVAQDKILGFKKILFFINIGLLFFVVVDLAQNKKYLKKLFSAALASLGLALLVGYGQLASTFVIPLHWFWEYWSLEVIPVFYGQALGQLLSYSNTWFSYYYIVPPTLRMFSTFPDSHSFALYCILGTSFLLPLLLLLCRQKKKLLFVSYVYLILVMAALLFTGSRGIWVSALMVLLVLFLAVFGQRWFLKKKSQWHQIVGRIGQQKITQLVLVSLVMLFILFPTCSGVLMYSQKIQGSGQGIFLLYDRAKSVFNFSEVSVKSRMQIWEKTVTSIGERPWLGVGIGNYARVLKEDLLAVKRGASAHNLYFDIIAEMGFFALFVFLAFCYEILKKAYLVYCRSQGLAAVFGAAFGLYFVWILGYSLFDVVLFNDKVLLFFVFAIGILYAAKSAPSPNKSADL